MNLREIISAFVAVETGLAITEPYPVTIKRIYRLLPPAGSAIVDTPCFMHQYRRIAGARAVGSRLSEFSILVQLLLARVGADTDVWSEIAAAFDEVIVNAFDHAVMLESTSAFQQVTDEFVAEYQPSIIEWNGVGYVGVQYEYRVRAHTNVVFS